MKFKFLLLFIFLVFSGSVVLAQISHGGQPWSFSHSGLKKASVFEIPKFDYGKMMEEDMNADRAKPYRYGKVHDVNLTPENSGLWQTLGDGSKIWQLTIKSEKAFSLSIISNQFNLDENASLYIYSPDKKQLIGSFTSKNNLENRYFSTVPIAGEEIIIELNIQKNSNYGVFVISGIVHDYKNILKTGYGSSGSCNINVNCPEGMNWQDEKRSVAKILFSGQMCTGALINNTSQNAKPYLLTAEHCISTQYGASVAVFWFNYESPGCISLVEPTYQSINASTLHATGGDLDFTLLELSSIPPVNYNIYYAGWNNTGNLADSTICIHHPSGDIKKISIDSNPPIIGDYGSGYVTNSHWNIIAWDKGTTEGGSSGSPLFDQNHHIVGDLTGGDASCSYNFNDYFARFDISWNHYPDDTTRQLKHWLDPLDFGVTTLDGFDPATVTEGLDAKINQVLEPANSFCTNDSVSPKIVIYNNGTVDINSVSANYRIGTGPVISEQWNGTLLPAQSVVYTFSKTKIQTGDNKIRFFVSDPNGLIDLKTFNDTLSKIVQVQGTIENLEIVGDNLVCSESLNAQYSTTEEGVYEWTAIGGEISGENNLKDVDVQWNKWGTRKIELNVTNLCNSLDANPIEIIPVELITEIKITTDSNGSEICWNITDCEGNLMFSYCDLPSNTEYTKRLALPPGCYTFNLNTGNAVVASFSVNDACAEFNIFSASNYSGNYSKTFHIESSENNVEFNLYPNPVQTELNIEAAYYELYEDASFSITNLAGMIVVPEQKLAGNTKIQVDNLPRGLYIIEINTTRGKFAGRILVGYKGPE